MTASPLRLRVFAALGLSPALALAACDRTGTYKGTPDDLDTDTDTDDEVDADHDGYPASEDCDDEDARVNPGAPERCNERDDNCNEEVDEGLDTATFWADQDGDGYGGSAESVEACSPPAGYGWDSSDCDDSDASVYPGGWEVCDGADNDCDGSVDLGTAYQDLDGDGFGGTAGAWALCEDLPAGWSTDGSDCDDDDAAVNPDAPEVCWDGVDNDCNGYRTCVDQTLRSTEGTCSMTFGAEYLVTYDPAVCSDCSFYLYADLARSLFESDTEACQDPGAYTYWYVPFESGLIPWDSSVEIVTEGWEDDLFRVEVRSSTTEGSVDWETTLRFELDADEVDVWYYYYYEGRPFTVEGRPRFAIPTGGAGWSLPLSLTEESAPEADPAVRARAARTWATAGRAEHASVASFARFALELMALGAPASLLAGASRAMADEVAHARACLGVARALGSADTSVGALDVAGSLAGAGDPAATLSALIREGCVGETVATARATRARQATTDPAIQQVLDTIIEDETRHAAYAWRCARWLLARHPELRDLARDTFARARASVPAAPAADPEAPGLARLGILDGAARNAATREAWREVVGPAAATLLGVPVPRGAAAEA